MIWLAYILLDAIHYFHTNAMILQILNGTIDPNWVMVILLALTAFLLGRVLNRIEKKQETHDSRINDHEVRITVIEKKDEG